MLNSQAQQNTDRYNAKDAEYMKALYESPRDEQKCLRLARELAEMSKGTALEDRNKTRVERHQRRINA